MRVFRAEQALLLKKNASTMNIAHVSMAQIAAPINVRADKAYMSTQREVLEGQTGATERSEPTSERGSGGPPPENFKNLHGKWCNLRYS